MSHGIILLLPAELPQVKGSKICPVLQIKLSHLLYEESRKASIIDKQTND